jgi:hypothetical protein
MDRGFVNPRVQQLKEAHELSQLRILNGDWIHPQLGTITERTPVVMINSNEMDVVCVDTITNAIGNVHIRQLHAARLNSESTFSQ